MAALLRHEGVSEADPHVDPKARDRRSGPRRLSRAAALGAVAFGALGCLLALFLVARAQEKLVLWAWERPEDLSFVHGRRAEVAAMVGFVELSGDRLRARGRYAPLTLPEGVRKTAVVHVEIDPRERLVWTPDLRRRTAAAVLAYARRPGWDAVQIDFEVRASQRQALLDLLSDVREGLGPRARLSMTALASWCDTETWLEDAPVDEIVPMLFRMGPGGEALKRRLAKGGDFREPRCRTAYGVATDQLPAGAPRGRRVYVFNPRSWSGADLDAVRGSFERWKS